jgi:hypothetical protein
MRKCLACGTAGLLAALALFGCSKDHPTANLADPAPVSGKIHFADGTPLKGGVVYFEPVDVQAGGGAVRYQAASLVDDKGNYKLGFNGDGAGAAPGEYKVTFTPRDLQELRGSNSAKIPPAYREKATTPLSVTVNDGENALDLVIK